MEFNSYLSVESFNESYETKSDENSNYIQQSNITNQNKTRLKISLEVKTSAIVSRLNEYNETKKEYFSFNGSNK